jgi:predicted Zn-dependent peptidase
VVTPGSRPRPGATRTLLVEKDGGGSVLSTVRRTVLPSGLRVVTEAMAGARSASVGVWVGSGSRDETRRTSGASHFLEHLLFKGTATRTALDISSTLDAVGGEFNAFTGKEYTCFHARVLEQDLPLAVDVLGDMYTSSLLSREDVEAERQVILDEIAMHDDDPEELAGNLLAERAYGATPLGRPVAGTAGSVAALTAGQVRRHYRSQYRPERTVVAVAGAVDHARAVRQVRRAFAGGGFLDRPAVAPLPRRATGRFRRARPGSAVLARPFEQVNLALGVDGLVSNDERRYALGVLNAVVGAGTSSRLFQEVRERRGLAYSVYSFVAHYADAGTFGVGVGCLPDRLDDVLAVVRHELRMLAEDGPDADEVERGKGQLRGGLVLGLEDTGARMSRLAKGELVYGELLGVDDVVARIDAVTVDDVRVLAKELLSQRETLAVVGPVAWPPV